MRLETELKHAMLEMYGLAGRDLGYWAHRFRQSVLRNGGLATAKRMLKPLPSEAAGQGFQRLVEAGRLDLSLEKLVRRSRFRALFTPAERRLALVRLKTGNAMAREVRDQFDNQFPNEVPPGRQYSEGSIKRVFVNSYERDPRARRDCVDHHGYMCAVCGMDFAKRYGKLGEKFIHVHHLRALHTQKRQHRLDPVKDLIPVCPNCHAMIHRHGRVRKVATVRASLRRTAG